MPTLTRTHRARLSQAGLELSALAELQDRFENCSGSAASSSSATATERTQRSGREVQTGIEQILDMQVGCWRPPVYVGAGPAR
jgi:hypothetical protein